jgi:hypothetical protein
MARRVLVRAVMKSIYTSGFLVVVIALSTISHTGQSAPRGGSLHDCYRKESFNKKDVVDCRDGDIVVGGGGECYGFDSNWKSYLVASEPSHNGNGWRVRCQNVTSGEEQIYSRDYAICCQQ